MMRKQAKRRRKQKAAPTIRLPKFPFRQFAMLIFALAIITLSYEFSARLLERPIASITIDGPFQRVSALQIEEAISHELVAGFFGANLSAMQDRIVSLPWIDQANIARRWPATLEVSVTEQIPAAVWGERGLLNTRGELFVSDARHVPAELPRLEGPDNQSAVVAERYLRMREKLLPTGLDLLLVRLDARGAWLMRLDTGIEIRLGRRDVEERAQLFLDVAANFIASREAEIEFVDMRYSNGFTIGWKNGLPPPASAGESRQDGMVAGLKK